MRDFSKALENIRKVIQDYDAEFRKEAGLEPRQPKPQPKLPSLKPQPKASHEDSGGKFAANRFLETSIGQEPVHQTAPQPQTQDNAPEIVEVLPQKDSRHSWLYNEVAKAVQNASDGNPNTKVVAVFVPVVQSRHELEELPVHDTVELPPVHEDDFKIEDEIDIQDDTVATAQEPDEHEIQDIAVDDTQESDMQDVSVDDTQVPDVQDISVEDTQELDAQDVSVDDTQVPDVQDISVDDTQVPDVQDISAEDTQEQDMQDISAEDTQEPDVQDISADSGAADLDTTEITEPEKDFPDVPTLPEELTAEPEQAEHLGELLPESIDHPDPELAEAFTTILKDDQTAEDIPGNNDLSDENHDLSELDLPELDDDEIIDDIDEPSQDTTIL